MTRLVVGVSVVLVCLLFGLVLALGYLTFCDTEIENTPVRGEANLSVGLRESGEVGTTGTRKEPMNIAHHWQNFTPDYINLTPSVVHFGEVGVFPQANDLKVRLVDVLNDGRCPANVRCGNSGWATVTVETEYQETATQHEMYIYGGNPHVLMPPEMKSNKAGSGNTLEIGPYRIFLVALLPYPEIKGIISKGDYQGLFLVDSVENLDFKKGIIAVAREELTHRLANHERYYAVGLVMMREGVSDHYRIDFIIPFGSSEEHVWVKVKQSEGQWRASEFGRQRE